MGSRSTIPAALTIAFGTVVAMWFVFYLTHLRGVFAILPPTVIGVLLLAIFAGGMALAGRSVPREAAPRAGAIAGSIAGLANLVILAALLVDEQGRLLAAQLAGFLVFATALGALAATLARRHGAEGASIDVWIGRFAVVAALAVVPVLLSGGVVTSTDAGLAVPDWPGSFGTSMFLLPLSKMVGGIFHEHIHRLFGALAGLTAIAFVALSIGAAIAARRRGVRSAVVRRAVPLSILGLLLIASQGVLGGARVIGAEGSREFTQAGGTYETVVQSDDVPANYAATTDTPAARGLAMVHGVSGQLVLTALVLAAAVVAPRWSRRAGDDVHPGGALRGLATAVFALVVLQLALGAGLRHFHHQHALIAHIVLAFVVLLLGLAAGFLGVRRGRETGERWLHASGHALAGSTTAQFALGWLALFAVVPGYGNDGPEPAAAVLVATAHQAVGAVVLASAGLLTLWSWRLLRSAEPVRVPALA